MLFRTSRWFVWVLFSLCGRSRVTCDFPINILGMESEMESCLGHHYLFISSASNYRSSSCSICKWDENRSVALFFFPLLIFFFFSLTTPAKIDSFLPCGAWKTSLHFARDLVGCCKVVVLKESKLIACDLSRITCSSHHFGPGKLLSMCCPSKHL